MIRQDMITNTKYYQTHHPIITIFIYQDTGECQSLLGCNPNLYGFMYMHTLSSHELFMNTPLFCNHIIGYFSCTRLPCKPLISATTLMA